jgi:hypothetical protein
MPLEQWHCDICKRSGSVAFRADESAEQVIKRIRAEHGSQPCTGDVRASGLGLDLLSLLPRFGVRHERETRSS